MGRGDKKSKKGKRFAGSYGRVRIRKVKSENFTPHIKEEEKEDKKNIKKKKSVTKKK